MPAYEQQVRKLGAALAADDVSSPSKPARPNPMVSVLHSHAHLA